MMERQHLVLLDADLRRAVEIDRVARHCGATVHGCSLADTEREIRGADDGGIAVVGVAADAGARSAVYAAIRRLKAAGFIVIGCLDGASRLPLGEQCVAFLAGCAHLLDSASADFGRTLGNALHQKMQEHATRLGESRTLRTAMGSQGIVGESKIMRSVFASVLRMAKLGCFPVLITGESGTGKELVANAVHRLDPVRSQRPFVAVNCAAIARDLAESELFGHRRGAFTGADRDRPGLFRSADGGVLFLDEVAELSEPLQAKLLRVLQEQRVLGVGSDREEPVNVRVVAATNADLPARVRGGTFRADLFNRLNALAIHLPPLRERREDIGPLAEHFIGRFSSVRGGKPLVAGAGFSAAISRLDLPGNARQLENLVRWILLNKTDDEPLGLRDLPPFAWEQLCAERPAPQASTTPAPPAEAGVRQLLLENRWSMSRALAECERLILRAALEREQGNQSRAARLLGITPRSVYNKLHKHPPAVDSGSD